MLSIGSQIDDMRDRQKDPKKAIRTAAEIEWYRTESFRMQTEVAISKVWDGEATGSK